jgi:tetratricopeptide (TPR) repeat protein
VAIRPDGKRFLSGSGFPFFGTGEARLWDVLTGKPVGPPLRHQRVVMAVAFSPDGRTALTGSRDGTARLWEAATGKELRVFKHPDGVLAVAFSPDGRRVLTGGEDRTARLWDVQTGRAVGVPFHHEQEVLAVAFSPDGRTVLTGGMDKTARLWNPLTGRPTGVTLHHQSWVRSVAFSPDGHTLLTGSGDDTARLWDTATGESIGAPFRHQSSVFAASFSPDGTTVLTGSRDRTARLWRRGAPLVGEVERIRLWAQAITGAEMVVTGAELEDVEVVHNLDARTWQERIRRMQDLGGSPLTPMAESAGPPKVSAEAILWHEQKAEASKQERHWFAVAFHLNRLLAAGPGTATLYERRGLAYCGLGQMEKAAADFARAVDLQPGECLFAFEHAGASALAGDADGYRRACTRLLERFGQSKDPWVTYTVARACLLTPQASTDLARLEKLAARAAAALPKMAWSRHTLGLASYRAGRFDEAVRQFKDSMQVDPKWQAQPANWLGLALAHHRLGQVAEARRWLDKADRWGEPDKGGRSSEGAGNARPRDVYDLHPHDVMACQLLRRELDALMRGPKP